MNHFKVIILYKQLWALKCVFSVTFHVHCSYWAGLNTTSTPSHQFRELPATKPEHFRSLLTLGPWRWRRQVPWKCPEYTPLPHG